MNLKQAESCSDEVRSAEGRPKKSYMFFTSGGCSCVQVEPFTRHIEAVHLASLMWLPHKF